MASQDQNIDHSEIKNSSVQQSQAGRDAVSFNNSHDNRVVIENTFLRLFARSESNQVDWGWAKDLLEKKQLPEIRKRLTDTLGRERILMDVSIAEQQQWVNRLQADRQLQVNGKDGGLLDPNKLLIETFGRDDIAGKLLILGAPGSGKTTALLSLAEQLVIGAIEQPKTVIPVILELSTWREDSQSIEAWIVEQLYDLHGGNRKEKIYEKYLERQVLLPLLDGLDELGLERQKKCTEKLNEFARTYPQLVVCCRVREFETANIKLSNLNGAICLQELSDRQIEVYFQSINRADLWTEMKTNSALQGLLQETAEGEHGLLRVPLFIKLLANVYDPQEPIKNKADLLEKHIERQLSFDERERDHRKNLKNHRWAYQTVKKEPKLDETINSLSWVARQLQANNTVELLIEKMQPSWINSKRHKLLYKVILGMILGLIFGLSFGPNFGKFWGAIFASIGGLTMGLMIGLLESNIDPIESFQISFSKEARQVFVDEFCNGFRFGWKLAFILVAIFAVIFFVLIILMGMGSNELLMAPLLVVLFGLFVVVFFGFIIFLLWGLLWGLVLGLVRGLISGFKQELKVRISPNQGIWNSIKILLWITVLSYPLGVIFRISLVSPLYFLPLKEPDHNWSLHVIAILWQNLEWIELIKFILNETGSLTIGLLWSLIFGVFYGGGLACVQHFSLRLVLWQSGTIPWNFARFLNYCVERRLLLRVGGRYRFLHRELLDHFAQLPPGTQIK
jgi:hypothetical protein